MRREEAAQEMELIVIEKINAVELFTGEKVDPLLEEIRQKAKSLVPDLSTAKSRKEIASMAYKIAQSKTMLDNLGKDLVADWKNKAKTVDSSRKHIRDYLDNLKDEVRKPLTDWEAEEARKEEDARLLAEYLADWEQAIADNNLIDREREVARKEAELAKIEAERLAKIEAERIEKERIEREEMIKQEAAEQAKREAEEKIARAESEKAEAARKLKEAEQKRKEDAEKAERDRIEAEKQAEINKQLAIEAAERKAKQEQERKEAARIEAERIEKEKADRKAANLNHQRRINNEALADLIENGLGETVARAIVEIIAKGKIRNISINY